MTEQSRAEGGKAAGFDAPLEPEESDLPDAEASAPAAAEGEPDGSMAAAEATAGAENETIVEGGEPLGAGAHEHAQVDEADLAGGDEETDDGEPEDGEDLVEEEVVVIRRAPFIGGVLVVAALILGLGGFAAYQQWLKPPASVATVNGSSISRKNYDAAVAKGDGKQILDGLVDKVLVEQDAAKQHVTVTDDDINAQLKTTKSRFATDAEYQQALQSNGISELDLRNSIRLQLLLNKLTSGQAAVADADIQAYYDQNKDSQFSGKTIDDVRDQIKQTLTDQKQQDADQTYLDQLRAKAKITTHLPGA